MADNSRPALDAGIEYVRTLSLGAVVLKDRNPELAVATERIDLDQLFQENAPLIIERCCEHVPAFVLAPLFMGVCAQAEMRPPNIRYWYRRLTSAFGESDILAEGIKLIDAGFHATQGEEEDVRRIRQLAERTSQLPQHLRLLPFVISCASNPPDLRQLLSFQVSVLLDQAIGLHGTYWAAIFCRMVAARWIAIAKEQTFRLVAPRVTANAIINAASPELFTLPQCARLLLVAAQAVGKRLGRRLRRYNSRRSRPSK